MDDFAFQLPDNAAPEMAAITALGQGLHGLLESMAELHSQHGALGEQVTALGRQVDEQSGKATKRKAPASIPWPLRWAELDHTAGSQAWVWLIDWVAWLVGRYQLVGELPHCWPQHPALVEELTALAAGWYAAYDEYADAAAPLVWHERFARSRSRLREWDDYTRCRNGTHTTRRLDLDWPRTWRSAAYDVAEADVAGRRGRPEDAGTNGGESA